MLIRTRLKTLNDELKILPVVEEHLGNDILGAELYFQLEVFKVGLQVWGGKMFLGISRNANTKIRGRGILKLIFKITALVHTDDLLQKI